MKITKQVQSSIVQHLQEKEWIYICGVRDVKSTIDLGIFYASNKVVIFIMDLAES